MLKNNGKSNASFHIIALIIVTIWGSTLVSTKVLLLNGMRPDEIFFARCVIAYVAMLAIFHKKLWADNWRDELLMVVLGVTGGSLYFIAENVALIYTYANNVSFIVSVSPLVTVFLAYFFVKGMKLNKLLVVGSLIAVVGVGIVIFNGQMVLKLNPLGDILAMLSTFCFGLYSLLLKILGKRYDSSFLTRKMFFYGLVTTLPLFVFKPWEFPLEGFLKLPVLGNTLFLGLIASFFCFAMWSVTIKRLGAVTASNYNYLSPIATIFISAMFLNEQMTWIAWIGCGLILVGVFLANRHNTY